MPIPDEVKAVVRQVVREQEQPDHLTDKLVRALEAMEGADERANTDELLLQRLEILFESVAL